MFGTTVLGADRGQWLPSPAQTPAPNKIGMTDVKQVEAATRAMRALDYQFGGGACRDAVVAQLSWAQRLLGASSTDEKPAGDQLASEEPLAEWERELLVGAQGSQPAQPAQAAQPPQAAQAVQEAPSAQANGSAVIPPDSQTTAAAAEQGAADTAIDAESAITSEAAAAADQADDQARIAEETPE